MTSDESAAAKRVVAGGYDRIVDRYRAWAAGIADDAREVYTRALIPHLADGAAVLDLGCGNGVPTLARLAERFRVTGVDLSVGQVRAARAAVPGAGLVRADMAALPFRPGSFDAVVSFYAITHLPRAEHAALFAGIARLLRPGGLFVAALGARDAADGVEDGWLGVPMFFSHYDAEENERLLRRAGFAILRASVEVTHEEGIPVPFWWTLARKPA